ncbi:MAG TPA: pantoate--beta-alanine ligase, partial [Polyangia bacterium]
ERMRALSISRALFGARDRVAAGERDANALVDGARTALDVDRLDYLELCDASTLVPLARVDGPSVLLVAAFVGRTRLIDNVRLAG